MDTLWLSGPEVSDDETMDQAEAQVASADKLVERIAERLAKFATDALRFNTGIGNVTIRATGSVVLAEAVEVIAMVRSEDTQKRKSAVDKDQAERIKALERALGEMTKDRDSWRLEFESTRRSWLRALGGRVFNKRHQIDALVLTTQYLRENEELWTREGAALAEARRLLEAERTLGFAPYLPVAEVGA